MFSMSTLEKLVPVLFEVHITIKSLAIYDTLHHSFFLLYSMVLFLVLVSKKKPSAHSGA